jgi:hypothetical protein
VSIYSGPFEQTHSEESKHLGNLDVMDTANVESRIQLKRIYSLIKINHANNRALETREQGKLITETDKK